MSLCRAFVIVFSQGSELFESDRAFRLPLLSGCLASLAFCEVPVLQGSLLVFCFDELPLPVYPYDCLSAILQISELSLLVVPVA